MQGANNLQAESVPWTLGRQERLSCSGMRWDKADIQELLAMNHPAKNTANRSEQHQPQDREVG